MKAVLALTASVAVANAALMPRQGIADIPQCALSCALGSLGSTGCQQTDFACICKANPFIDSLVPCVQSKCSASDYEKTLTAAQGLCQQAGVSLSIPAGAATSAAGSSSAAATTSAPSTEATGVTSASSEPTSAATSAASSAVTSAAVTSAATQSSAAATTTGAPTKASGSNSTVSSTSPPKPSGTEPSAAHRNTIALGGLGAIIALVAAFL